MAKWYRISLSLASKCRVGFAIAVFIIIGAALILPYRWMDKLVEQGKLEQAQAEMQHVLERHFQPIKDLDQPAEHPPLALEAQADHRVITARWDYVENKNASNPDQGNYIVAPAPINPTADRGQNAPAILQQRPVTRWVALPDQLKPLISILQATSDNTLAPPPEEDSVRILTDEQKKAKADIKTILQKLTDDPFIHEGLRDYVFKNEREEVFELRQSAHYLRGVWAGRDCLTSGCHSSQQNNMAEADTGQKLPRSFIEGQLLGVISVNLPQGQTGPTLLFNRLFIIVGGFLAGICAMITFYLITQRFILHPVRSLRAAADQVTVPTDPVSDEAETLDSWQAAMRITADIKTGDEFEKLADAFHHMLERLRKAQDELRQTNRALDLQVDKLAEQNVALFESNRLKSEFLANVSHELRTPLNAIIGFAEILKEKVSPEENEKQSRYIDNVLSAGKMLHSVINDLLDLAKIEAGKMQVHWDRCSISEIVEVLINFTRPMALNKNLDVYLDIDDHLGLVESDPGKLQQILFNLLSNAIKFTPENGRIDVKADDVDDKSFELLVADTGPGIAAEDQEKVFEKFLQLDGSVTREHSGTGLGLAIVKELVEMLGGSISLTSQVSQGTIFRVRLPKHKPNIIDLEDETLRAKSIPAETKS